MSHPPAGSNSHGMPATECRNAFIDGGIGPNAKNTTRTITTILSEFGRGYQRGQTTIFGN